MRLMLTGRETRVLSKADVGGLQRREVESRDRGALARGRADATTGDDDTDDQIAWHVAQGHREAADRAVSRPSGEIARSARNASALHGSPASV
jgi:hypothetical protein